MQSYIVGGAVRDQLLNLPVQDRDWVVVGATPEQMIQAGFKPVGKDFPVFLHPDTREEYALARTERKTAQGYHGFSFYTAQEVTLEQDLARRDLTINAMALHPDGTLIDPYHGHYDLEHGILRHVSLAFVEDPVRILRIARFAARFDFKIADETMQLMQHMVDRGEADALVAERIWQELAKGLMEPKPSRLFGALRQCGALKCILPEIDALFSVPQHADNHPEIDAGGHTMRAIDYAAHQYYPLPTRFATLTHDLDKILTSPTILSQHTAHEAHTDTPLLALCHRLRVPTACRDLARITVRYHALVHSALTLEPQTVFKLFKQTDAIRRPERFYAMLHACLSNARGHLNFEETPYPQLAYLKQALQSVLKIDAGDIAHHHHNKQTLPYTIDQARIAAITPYS